MKFILKKKINFFKCFFNNYFFFINYLNGYCMEDLKVFNILFFLKFFLLDLICIKNYREFILN